MSIVDKIRPAFQKVEGGLFSEINKADIGDAVSTYKDKGIVMMSWADPAMPDPSIPDIVKQRAIEAIKSGLPSHYTTPTGDLTLKEALCKRIKRYNGLDLDPRRNIIINPGSDIGLIFSMTPFINPGDEVLIHDPSYPSNFLNAELLGGVSIKVPTYEEDNYHLRIEEYEKRLTDKSKVVLLTSPNNPTGTVYTREELEELSKFIIKNDLVCICDQAFEDTVFVDNEMTSIATIEGMWERTLTVCSVSKGMGLSGFRVGWTYGPDTIMDKLFATAVNIQGATSTLSQIAVLPAVEDDSFIKDYNKRYDERRHYAYKLFNSIPGVSMNLPESGFFSWINVSMLANSGRIVEYLLKEAKVSCNDGIHYGDKGKRSLKTCPRMLLE